MKPLFYAIMLIVCISGSFTCKSPSTTNSAVQTPEHNSRNSLDWDGVYRGIMPCADCPGIQTAIILNKNLQYTIKTKYIDRSDSVFERSGTFDWNDRGNMITLQDPGHTMHFLVGENTLTQVDSNGNMIVSQFPERYILRKSNNATREKTGN